MLALLGLGSLIQLIMKRSESQQTITGFFTKKKKEDELDEKHLELEIVTEKTKHEHEKFADIDQESSTSR